MMHRLFLLRLASLEQSILRTSDITRAAQENTLYTSLKKPLSPRLLSRAKELGMELIDVKQGYARCSSVPIDENSIITYDQGIGRTCQKLGLNVLAGSPGHVNLPGYETGFIGETAGTFDNEILLAGNVINHPDGEMIIRFIEERGKRIKYFKDFPLTDIGSVI